MQRTAASALEPLSAWRAGACVAAVRLPGRGSDSQTLRRHVAAGWRRSVSGSRAAFAAEVGPIGQSDGCHGSRTVLKSLQARYDERQCAFQVAQVAGGYQLMSRREFVTWVRPQSAQEHDFRLSPPALETLVVVAYRQPMLRAEVEAIRGVACGEILRQLLDRDLLRIVGRSEELGRPLRYGTTKRFLEVFGLSNLEELPWAGELRRTDEFGSENAESSPINAIPEPA